jgi:hypothetical protein
MVYNTETKAEGTLREIVKQLQQEYERRLETQAHNMVMLTVLAFLLGVGIGAVAINYINCLYIP